MEISFGNGVNPNGGAPRTKRTRRVLALGLLAAVAATGAMMMNGGERASASSPAATPRTGMVALAGNVLSVARPEFETGRVDAATKLQTLELTFSPTAAQKADRAALLRELSDPTSPRFHQWLAPQEVAARFGPDPLAVARVTTWLESEGFQVRGLTPTGARIQFKGTVGQLEHAFATEVHHYVVDGERHFAMSREPSIPAALDGIVYGLRGAHNFRPKPPTMRKHEGGAQWSLPIPEDGGTFNIPALAPADFATIYDVGPLYAAGIDGTGQKIAIMGQTDVNSSDVDQFRSQFSLPSNPIQKVVVPGTGDLSFNPGDMTESILDLEWSGAIAKNASILFVVTGQDDGNGVFDSMAYAIENDTAPIISLSYGGCEVSDGLTANEAVFSEYLGDVASMEGVTLLVASGDQGAAGCDHRAPAHRGLGVSYPASIPSVVAVGGTQFNLTKANLSQYLDSNWNALGYIPESTWNETLVDIDAGYSSLGSSGGGVSVIFPKPPWQVPYTPADNARDVPDVALAAAADIMPYTIGYSWTAADGDAAAVQPWALTAVGGTSAATPSFAAILALVNEAVQKANPTLPSGLGNANPILYAIANNSATASAFHDITMGDNQQPCKAGSTGCPDSGFYGYDAGPGYDLTTGLGTVDAEKLAQAWTALAPTSVKLATSTSATNAGITMNLTATVTAPASAGALGGKVLFYVSTISGPLSYDLSEPLAVVPVEPGKTAGTGTATACTAVPAGYTGAPSVVAFYSGDPKSLAAWSSPANEKICSTLQLNPPSSTAAAGGTVTLTATGGVPPYQWMASVDNTCAAGNPPVCSKIDGGVVTAGANQGLVVVSVWDSQLSEQRAAIYFGVSPADAGEDADLAPNDGGPLSCPVLDAAGTCSAVAPTGGDAGSEPASKASGCSCDVAGKSSSRGAIGAVAALLFGIVALSRRKRSA